MAKTPNPRPRTRIQREKTDAIMDAALEVFSAHGFRGSTIDQIAGLAGLSKPNLLYYFDDKEAIHTALIGRLLETWLEPLKTLDPDGDPEEEILAYVMRKLEMARDYPRESRIFANEMLQGAPRLQDYLQGALKNLVDHETGVIQAWIDAGRLAPIDPYHLIFSIWATTQHYADFDVQVQAVLGKSASATRFDDAATYLRALFSGVLRL